jgi:hypothetical protein
MIKILLKITNNGIRHTKRDRELQPGSYRKQKRATKELPKTNKRKYKDSQAKQKPENQNNTTQPPLTTQSQKNAEQGPKHQHQNQQG